MLAQVGAILGMDHVGLTHRDGGSILVHGTAVERFTVQLNTIEHHGKGPLPAHVVRAQGEGLDDEVSAIIATTLDTLPARLDPWLRDVNTMASDPNPELCFEGPAVVGLEEACGDCQGRGRVRCKSCDGRGETVCVKCDGQRELRCTTCAGTQLEPCRFCNGRGRWWERPNVDSPDELMRCVHCRELGKLPCRDCDGVGTIPCHHCSRTGSMRCKDCGGRREVPCAQCDGHGEWHVLREIRCELDGEFLGTVNHEDADVRTGWATLSRSDMQRLGQVVLLDASVKDAVIERRYDVEMRVSTLYVEIEGEDVRLIGFGETGEIRDFKHIAERRLENDVAGLRRAVEALPLLPIAPAPALCEALDRFLRTGTTAAMKTITSGAPDARTKAEEDLGDGLSARFAREARETFVAALWRGLAPSLLVRMTPALLVPAGVWYGLQAFTTTLPRDLAAAVVLIAAGVGTAIAELVARRRLAHEFSATTWSRLKLHLEEHSVLWYLRGSIVVAGILLWWFLIR